jgi:hypothetical protein
MRQSNGVAFWVGFLIALFPSIYGVAHLLNGKLGGALKSFLIFSIIWPAIVALLVSISAGLCAIVLLPLHVYFAYTQAKEGATIGY